MKNIKEWSLKNKIILHVAAVGSVVAFLMAWLCMNTQKNILQVESEEKAALVGSMIEKSIYTFMKEGRIQEVQATIDKITSVRDIKSIRILDTKGVRLRSSTHDETGSVSPEKTLINLNKYLSGANPSGISFLGKNSLIQGFRRIENTPECFECHSPLEKVNGIIEVNIDYSDAVGLLRRNRIRSILVFLLSLIVLTFIILRFFNRLVNRPVSRLKERMERVQEGNLDIDFPPAKNDEIGSLARSFAVMVKKLKDANLKIEELFKTQMEKAEHLASIGELAAGLAHEIKNPLAGIKGALEIINQEIPRSSPKKEIFEEMAVQIDRINNIIQDLLRYAKPKEMAPRLVLAEECIETAILLAKPQVGQKDIMFHFDKSGNGRLVLMDANKIQEVVLNLLLNSINAIEAQGNISIKLIEDERELKIIVSDDGSGIKKEHLSQIFHPFFTTKKNGTGLGLSICRRIIEGHRGSIEVQSKEGKGTTFTILLPIFHE